MSGVKSDQELLDAWREGDREAGDELFSRHFDAIYDFFDRKVSHDVSDLVQRTFLGCVQGIGRFRGECSPRTFLYAIARNELCGFLRKKQRDKALDFGISSLRDMGPSPSSVLGRRDHSALLVAALETIPLDLQILLELRFWQGMTAREAALVLEIPPGTVASRLRRAMKLLRERLGELHSSRELPFRDGDEASFEAWAKSVRPYAAAPITESKASAS